MNEVLLARIAVALEGINDKLECISNSVELLEKLSDCVDDTNERGEQFCITGTVVNYEG